VSVSTDAAYEGMQAEMSSQTLTLLVRNREPISCGEVDPLYLFACQVQWRTWCSEDAGWELLAALTSSDIPTQMVARALLQSRK
jgi:hypothetical protein